MPSPSIESGDLVLVGAGDLDSRMQLIARWVQRGYADPWSHEKVAEWCKGLNPMDDRAEIDAVFRELSWPKVRYAFHPSGRDRFQTMRRTVETGAGDCDNSTVALCTALSILGFQVGARIYSWTGDSWDHITALVGLPRNGAKGALVLDPTTGPDGTPKSAYPGFQVPWSTVHGWRDFTFKLS